MKNKLLFLFIALLFTGCSKSNYTVTETSYGANGQVQQTIVKEFNNQDQIVKLTINDEVTTYEYENNLCIKMTLPDGEFKYFYDGEKLVQLDVVDPSGNLHKRTYYEYDENDNVIYNKTVADDEIFESFIDYNDLNQMIAAKSISSEGETNYEYQYDENGNLIEENIKDENGNLTNHVYSYEQNLKVKEILNYNGEEISTTKFVYDNKDRLIEMYRCESGDAGCTIMSTIEYSR